VEIIQPEFIALLMIFILLLSLLLGYPVAFTLGGISFLFGTLFLEGELFNLLPLRIWGILTNTTLLAVPLFILMGIILEKSGLAEQLIKTMGQLFSKIPGGLALSIVLVGTLLAATTGVVGATVVTMGIIALPSLLKNGYSPPLATGTIAASGTLGQIIPPSIILILLADIVGVSVGQLFMGALIPGGLLVLSYLIYIILRAYLNPADAPSVTPDCPIDAHFYRQALRNLLPILLLVLTVLGTLFTGIATPSESAAFGALGALLLSLSKKQLTLQHLTEALQQTTRLTSMVFLILIGATAFGLVFRGLEGDQLIKDLFSYLPGGETGFIITSLLLIFLAGFFLDFLEICFIILPILLPVAQHYQIDLLWFSILVAVNLQTSFLTPPFGFSLFYLKAVSPPTIHMNTLYKGIVPFVILQLLVLGLLIIYPSFVLWLPHTYLK